MAAGISLFISLMTDSSRASSSYRHLRVLTYARSFFFFFSFHRFTSIELARRSHFLSFFRHHRRPIHDPSISHFPEKINGANFRLYRIYNATRPVIFHLLPSSAVGVSGRFPTAGPIEEKITGLSSLFAGL